MSRQLSDSGQVTVLVLVGLILLAIPAGLAVVQGLSTSPADERTIPTVTQPVLTSPPFTETPADTATPTADDEGTETEPSGGGDDQRTPNGQLLVVDQDSGITNGRLDASCDNAEFQEIQAAVDNATKGDTVVVCEGTYPESVTVETANVTLRANGSAVITSIGEPAIRTNASGITIRGFTVRSQEGADYAIAVGGRKTLIRDTTVNTTNVGIFLSDGIDEQNVSDLELGAATGSRVVHNTLRGQEQTNPAAKIWADADKAVIRDNSVSSQYSGSDCGNGNAAIVSSGIKTVLRDNSVHITTSCHNNYWLNPSEKGSKKIPGIQIGAPPKAVHNMANQSLIVNNSVSGAAGPGIQIGDGQSPEADNIEMARRTIVRNNSITNSGRGIEVWSYETVVRNNKAIDNPYGKGVVIHSNSTIVIGNTLNRNIDGVAVYGKKALVGGNTIRNNQQDGVDLAVYAWGSARVVGNNITGNVLSGIRICCGADPTQFEIHRNRIRNNAGFGIHNVNAYRSDGKWPIVNATNNYWGCGGPSGEVKDPYTGRVANGSGDTISAGDKPDVSNVHFDPFLELASCHIQTPTRSPSPTPTPPPTSTPTPTSNGGVDENGGDHTANDDGGSTEMGGGDGTRTGGSSGFDSEDSSESNDGGAGEPALPTSTATRTPTATPPQTATPKPAVEAGFDVVIWIIAFTILVSLLATRHRD